MLAKPVLTISTLLLACVGQTAIAQNVDAKAAEALVKKSGCLTCHAVDRKKDGPSFKETAARLKGKPDAEKELQTFLTTHPKIKVAGNEEEHASLKTTNDADVRNVVGWILSR
jgi:cytochrome c